jgi:protein arginine kinase
MEAIARGTGAWFVPAGPESDLVLSTRIRIARNLDEVRFTTRATERELHAVLSEVVEAALHCPALRPEDALVMTELGPLDRHVLLEHHLISAEFAEPEPARALVPGDGDGVSVMVNEEDHLRIQGIRGGLQLYECWETVASVDATLGQTLDYAFHEDLGYLTACPSNVGTGLRVSVLLHLPCLVLTQDVRKVIDDVQAVGLSVRGFYGEGSDVVGNFFQVSNQITLGKTEEELLDMLEQVTREVMQKELGAREWLWSDAREQISDKIYRALGTLRSCRLVSSAEVVAASSALRLGRALAMADMPSLEVLNRLVVFCQPAHVQRLAGRALGPSERRVVRAGIVRRLMQGMEPVNGAS